MNAARKRQRPARLSRCSARTELHQGGRKAGGFTIGVEPYRSRARGTTRPSIADSHDTERLADRGGRTSGPDRGASLRRDRGRAGIFKRVSREARRHHPHFGRRACGQCDPLASLDEVPAALPGHQGRDHRRPQPDRHRCPALRRRRAIRRTSGEGHDRRPYRTGHAYGGRRCAVVFREAIPTEEAPGPERAQLHQSATTDLWRPVCLGVRKRRPRAEGARGRPAGPERHHPDAQCGAGGIGPGLCATGLGAASSGRGSSHPGARGLVPSVFGLPPLLPEPTPILTGVCPADRCAALPEFARGDEVRMSEVRALLLTDVVDSTQLSERLGEAELAALWAAHDRLARDLLEIRRGREIDKTDGMLLLFEAPADAVAYAMEYQRAVARLNPPLKARAGVHVGPVILRENRPSDVARGAKPLEVEGTAKAVAARVMSVANGGQTLLSADARNALGKTALRLESHGHWRMKGIAEPIELFEIGEADAAFVPPPDAAKGYRVVREGDLWLPARNIKHSLPAERDSFVNRRETLAELARRLDAGARLVSVLGIGGTGKTRLVTRFGWSWLGDFPGGAWFCDLSRARSLDGIVHAVGEALAVPLGKEDPVTQLGNAIAARGRCLVILDNFEQVSRWAEETLGRWLNRAMEAGFVVTTREVLGLVGEETLALAPLQAPDAAALFVQRAESAKRGFLRTAADRAAIDPLVKLLEGLPLAIELAATRVRVMSPRTLLSRMRERFKLLSSSGRRRDRQATLRSTFDWSWDLLSLADKAALAQLSVFEGGFTMESAEAVLDLSGYEDAPWTVGTVQSLLDKSFVRQVKDGRFDMLVSVQEYASEHLRTERRFPGSGPSALAAAEARHSGYFARLGEKRAVAGACVEIDNLVAACRRAAARGAGEEAAGALEGAWAALNLRGPFSVGVELASVVSGTPGLGASARATAERVAGSALDASGRVAEARTHLEA